MTPETLHNLSSMPRYNLGVVKENGNSTNWENPEILHLNITPPGCGLSLKENKSGGGRVGEKQQAERCGGSANMNFFFPSRSRRLEKLIQSLS